MPNKLALNRYWLSILRVIEKYKNYKLIIKFLFSLLNIGKIRSENIFKLGIFFRVLRDIKDH